MPSGGPEEATGPPFILDVAKEGQWPEALGMHEEVLKIRVHFIFLHILDWSSDP